MSLPNIVIPTENDGILSPGGTTIGKMSCCGLEWVDIIGEGGGCMACVGIFYEVARGGGEVV
jgi:hypothetical protein